MSTLDRLAALATFIVISMILTNGCRQYRIDNCIEDGGTPNVPSWFVNDPADVRCIYGLEE